MLDYNEVNKEHWNYSLYAAYRYHEEGQFEEAFNLLRNIYEQNEFHYDKDIHGSYETYVIEKVTYLKELAKLSMVVTKKPERSLPYLDEALIMLDSYESVHPYISPKEVEELKDSYMSQIK